MQFHPGFAGWNREIYSPIRPVCLTKNCLVTLCLAGLQASSSGQVMIDDVSAVKRANPGQSEEPPQKKKKKESACFW